MSTEDYSRGSGLLAVGPGLQRLFKKGVIKKDRIKFNLSQKKFAKMLHVSTTKLRNWESGKKKPDLEQAQEINRTLRVLTIERES